MRNLFKEIINSLELTEQDDFKRVWSLIQNHGWLLASGEFIWTTFRVAGSILAEIDNIEDTEYMSYYCEYIFDERTAFIQMALITHPKMSMIMSHEIEKAWVSLGLKPKHVPAYVLGKLDIALGVSAENAKRSRMRELSAQEIEQSDNQPHEVVVDIKKDNMDHFGGKI